MIHSVRRQFALSLFVLVGLPSSHVRFFSYFFHDRRSHVTTDYYHIPMKMLRSYPSFHRFVLRYTVLLLLLLLIFPPDFNQIGLQSTSLCPPTLNSRLTSLLLLVHPFRHAGIYTRLPDKFADLPHISVCRYNCSHRPFTPLPIPPPPNIIMPVVTRANNNSDTSTESFLANYDEFPPLGLTVLPNKVKNKKPTSTSNPVSDPKKARLNGTTPTKPHISDPVATTKTSTDDATMKPKEGILPSPGPNQSSLTEVVVVDTPTDDKEGNKEPISDPHPRKLEKAFGSAENSNKGKTASSNQDSQRKKGLSFTAGTTFPTTTVDSFVKRIAKPATLTTSNEISTKKPLKDSTTPTYSIMAALPMEPTAKTSTKTKKTNPPPVFNDPAPQGLAPTTIQHNFTFVARVELTLPNCSSFQYKVMNLLAYAMNILRQSDKDAAYICLKDTNLQAATIQELPKLTTFFNDWSYFEHTIEEFRHYQLAPGKVKKYRASVFLGCNQEPKTLLENTLLDLDKDLDPSIGGGKVTLSYKEMQVVDTDRYWILFGVPSETNPEAFTNLLKPFLMHELIKMKDKNPKKYEGAKFTTLPDFVLSVMYVQNVPFKMTEGLPPYAKQCIHIEIRQSDKEVFKELFKFITLTKSDKKQFGQFARFHYGCPPGSSLTERETLGGMLQNHIAVVRSMGKVSLPGIMHPDKIMPCLRDDPLPTVHISLRRIMMKQKIGRVKVWQCILPNSGGGWDGYYANGFGCGEHRSQALHWAVCVPAHLRFHLLRRGVLVESVKDFIDSIFTYDMAQEAFGAKLIQGQVYTPSAASAASMRIDIEKCGWVNVNLGISGADTNNPTILSRPHIALKENSDLGAHNFSTDRNPDLPDSASIAYSTSDTTLGDEIETEIDDEHNNVETIEINDEEMTLATEGSSESQIWNVSIPSQANNAIIDNMFDLLEHNSEAIQTTPSPQNIEPQTVTQNQLADLLRQITLLQETNEKLMAAVASNNTQNNIGSHPTSQPPDRQGASGQGDGGNN